MDENQNLHESAVREKRIWIRLNRLCNNRCIFCLDSDTHDGTIVPFEVVAEEMKRGRDDGGQRLILSGGEATLHPRYLELLALGKQLGYTWIQTITNGRMFAYPAFAQRALKAGLQEVTISMHGHNDALHDRLVGVPGAFKQSMAGLKNLLGRCIVSVDIVLNKQNVPHLREILKFFIDLGVSEFDLLHMVPFGRAWTDHRDELFYDPAQVRPYLARAFALRKRHNIVLWTNRLPAPFLEDEEDLIQDPHKLHDEVRGRREMLQAYADQGTAPCCLGDRCQFCPMDGFCAALASLPKATGSSAPASALRLNAQSVPLLKSFVSVGALAHNPSLVLALPPESTLADVESLRHEVTTAGLGQADIWVEFQQLPNWELPDSMNARLLSLTGASPEAAAQFAGRPNARGERWFPMEAALIPLLQDELPLRPGLTRCWTIPREYLSESKQWDASPEELRTIVESMGSVMGMPLCLGGQSYEHPGCDLTLFEGDGTLNLQRFTDWFIKNKYWVKSLRCSECRHHDSCSGLHINYVRNYGFRVMTPIKDACDG